MMFTMTSKFVPPPPCPLSAKLGPPGLPTPRPRGLEAHGLEGNAGRDNLGRRGHLDVRRDEIA